MNDTVQSRRTKAATPVNRSREEGVGGGGPQISSPKQLHSQVYHFMATEGDLEHIYPRTTTGDKPSSSIGKRRFLAT